MRLFFFISIFSFAFFCCQSNNQKHPSVLSEKQMTDIMWDMLKADMYVQDYVLKDSTKKKNEESTKLYDEIFHIHGVTADQFKKSLNYYQSQPAYFKPILDSLLTKQRDLSRPILSPRADSFRSKPHGEIQKQ